MKIKAATLKGFRDFLPEEARKRQYVINALKKVFESYGFEPLETPTLEYAQILEGKYGEEGDLLMYKFEDRGKRKVAMRYDQTVPLARVIAQYKNDLPIPFKRYQIQNVWRAENTQKGRYREFLQCDADIVGSASSLSDAEILNLVLNIYKNLGLEVIIKINDRANFENLDKKFVAAVDKIEKLGESYVISEMVEKGMKDEDAKKLLAELSEKPITPTLQNILDELKKLGADMSKIKYEPTLARGLDYYTGLIFETVTKGSSNSLCSGGRYDKLIGMFSGDNIPAIGFGLGFDRTIEALEEKKLIPKNLAIAKVLVTVFAKEYLEKSIELAKKIRSNNINAELYLDEAKLDKQIKYADKKKIPFVVILGPEEVKEDVVTLKDLRIGQQTKIKEEELINALK